MSISEDIKYSEQTQFSERTQFIKPAAIDSGRLVVLDSGGKIQEYMLSSFGKNTVLIGRGDVSDIFINSNLVSRSHAQLRMHDGSWYIEDLNSTNGTFVNGRLLAPTGVSSSYGYRLEEGDIIRIDNITPGMAKGHGVIMLFTFTRSVGKWKRFDLLGADYVSIGRSEKCDIVLGNVSVSRKHAEIYQRDGYLFLNDLHSFNGVFVNGKRINSEHALCEKDIIRFANSIAIFSGGVLFYKSDNGGTKVRMQNVSRSVKSSGGEKCILSNVSLTVDPNEFVAIIGGSGAGKSTIMNAMSGFEHATKGQVFVNSVNLYENYDVLKNIIGYVPQQEIIYENLSLYDMLEFSAQMRMPEDISETEREARISEVLKLVELTEHKRTLIRELSGGQKKRASIAVELLADPGLFFLDEPTSGLDPGTEESLMITLSKLAADKGKTIIMVTHTTQNLRLCDKILFMGKGGKVCYYGSPQDCLNFFKTDSLTKIYNMLSDDRTVDMWSQKFYSQYEREQRRADSGDVTTAKIFFKKPAFFKQLGILCHRYTKLILNDWHRLIMLFAQPVGITILLSFVAADGTFVNFEDTRSILFALTCGAIWTALFNSIQEICKERNILKREYMANLRLGTYVLSKFIVQFILCAVQMLLVTILFKLLVGGSEDSVLTYSGLLENYISLTLTAFASAAIGLIISAVAKNPDKAMTVAPFVLIIQLLFSGILFALSDYTEFLSYFTVSRWAVSALGTVADLNSMPSKIVIPGAQKAAEDIFEFTKANLFRSWGIMLAFTVICAVGCILILRNVKRDSR